MGAVASGAGYNYTYVNDVLAGRRPSPHIYSATARAVGIPVSVVVEHVAAIRASRLAHPMQKKRAKKRNSRSRKPATAADTEDVQ